MNEKPPQHDPQETGQEGQLLGKIPPGEFDTQLNAGSMHAETTTPQTTGHNSEPPSQGTREKLDLPPGALVAMRSSGGFVFSSLCVTVYYDGRITVDGRSGPGTTEAARVGKLSGRDADELARALHAANLPGLPPGAGHQNPDAYAYEISARLNRVIYSVELFDGSIPDHVKPLVQVLDRIMNQTA
jgi:hypothetical protein